jgi:hypothetical protein
MKKILILCLFSINAYAVDIGYRFLEMKVPKSEEIIDFGLANIQNSSALLVNFKKGLLIFNDRQFDKDCVLIKKIIKNMDCNHDARLSLLNEMFENQSDKKIEYFFAHPESLKSNYPDGLQRKEYKHFMVYSLIQKKMEESYNNSLSSFLIVIEKKSGQTINIQGNVEKKHLEWLYFQ